MGVVGRVRACVRPTSEALSTVALPLLSFQAHNYFRANFLTITEKN